MQPLMINYFKSEAQKSAFKNMHLFGSIAKFHKIRFTNNQTKYYANREKFIYLKKLYCFSFLYNNNRTDGIQAA